MTPSLNVPAIHPLLLSLTDLQRTEKQIYSSLSAVCFSGVNSSSSSTCVNESISCKQMDCSCSVVRLENLYISGEEAILTCPWVPKPKYGTLKKKKKKEKKKKRKRKSRQTVDTSTLLQMEGHLFVKFRCLIRGMKHQYL